MAVLFAETKRGADWSSSLWWLKPNRGKPRETGLKVGSWRTVTRRERRADYRCAGNPVNGIEKGKRGSKWGGGQTGVNAGPITTARKIP